MVNNSNYQLIPVTSCNIALRSFLGGMGSLRVVYGKGGFDIILSFVLIFNCIVFQTSTQFEMTFFDKIKTKTGKDVLQLK